MESVLRIVGESSLGSDVVAVHATYSSRGLVRTIRHLIAAARSILGLKRRTVVHVHLSVKGSYVREGALVLLAHLRRLPIVVTNHGSRFMTFSDSFPRLVARVTSWSDVTLCLSPESLARVQVLAPGKVALQIRNPVPTDLSSPPASQTAEVVLFAGAVGSRKGVDVLIRAWEAIERSNPDAKLLIAGPQGDVQVPTSDQIVSLGRRSPEEVRELVREARVVVLPSRNEALPMILAEALAAGRPFVSTPIAGIPELANGVQALVPVGDHVELSKAIALLLQDPELAESRGEAGRRFHEQTRSIEAMEPVMRNVYKTALEAKQ